MSYAKGTTVAVGRTQVEIEQLVSRYGATQFVRGWTDDRVALGFTIEGRQVRIELPLPAVDDRDLTHTPTGKRRTASGTQEQYDAEIRRRWRALLAVLKAKLVAVEDGISTIEREFLADIVLPNGATIGEWASAQIAHVYDTAEMPALLPGSTT
jgi:hypothetical protein